MFGVCIDVANLSGGAPNKSKLKQLGVQLARAEIRHGYEYPDFPLELLVGPSTGKFFLPVKPKILIIGNEPDSCGSSSWSMNTNQYIDLYNSIADTVDAEIRICTAGMYNTEYLEQCWQFLHRKPDIVNVHYPKNEQDIIAFRIFGRPVMVGETCYKTATQEQMDAWIATCSRYAEYTNWFCYAEEMVENMGLYKNGRLVASGRRFQAALRKV